MRNVEVEMEAIVREVMENGRAATQEEMEVEFQFSAQEAGWTEEEIKMAIQSPWFPEIS